MIKIFKTFGGYTEINEIEKNCWINVTAPTQSEIQRIINEFKLPDDIVEDILDPDERSRVEFEDDWTVVIMRIPIRTQNNGIPFQTIPLGVFLAKDFVLTLCLRENEILPADKPSPFKRSYKEITDNYNFILRLLLRSGDTYLRYLKQINIQASRIELELQETIKNEKLTQLLKMEKCLVYFLTSIKANKIVFARLRRSKKINSEINEDLLEDAEIENLQALEMAQIYSDILSETTETFASIISNNMNEIMKKLTLISIILMIPTLISGIYGMNVPNYIEHNYWSFPAILFTMFILSAWGVYLFRRKEWF